MAEQGKTNAAQSAAWNDGSGKAWVSMQDLLDRMLASVSPPILDAGFPGGGGSVLDIGCGAGATTLAMARRVGAQGHCTGLDISRPLIEAARLRAAAQALPNVRFVEGDAQTERLSDTTFDAVISRFGVMFFDDPTAAFVNIQRMARPGARLAFAAWRSPAENPFMTTASRAAAHLLPPAEPADPNAPGQFAFADRARVARILTESGWSSIDIEPVDAPCAVAEDELMSYVTRLGPVGAVLREADKAMVEKVTTVMPQAFAPYIHDGVARFAAACWLVTGRA